jgi:hypothetical protein
MKCQTREGFRVQASRVPRLVTAKRDILPSNAVLRGGRVITMRGNEVIENADVVIRNPTSLTVPRTAGTSCDSSSPLSY